MRTRPNRALLRRTIIVGSSIPTPTAFWNLDEASGSNRNDSCSSPSNLSVNGTVTQVSGKINNAANAASGSNYLINFSDAKLNASGAFSVAGWFNLSNSAGGIIASNGNVSSNGWKITASSTEVVLTTYQSLGVSTSLTKSRSISTGVWYFFAAYYESGVLGIALEDDSSFTTGSGSACAGSNGITLLNEQGGLAALQGSADEFGYWVGRALTIDEKQALYNSGSGKTFNGSAWV